MCYTTNGTTPATNGSTGCTTGTLYSTVISIPSTLTLKVVAGGTGYSDSTVASYAYVIALTVVAPTLTPGTGTYGSQQTVTISTTTPGAAICWAPNTTTPAGNGSGGCSVGTQIVNGGTITVNFSKTVNAIGTEAGYTDSSVTSAVYTLQVAAPSFSPSAGTYGAPQFVTISSTTPGATFCYTLDGTTPTTTGTACSHGTTYSGTITIPVTEVLTAIGFISGWTTSPVTAGTYVIATQPFFPNAAVQAAIINGGTFLTQ
jgi:hypothetical protein